MKLMTLSLPAGYITGVCNDLIPLFDENATLQLIYTKKSLAVFVFSLLGRLFRQCARPVILFYTES